MGAMTGGSAEETAAFPLRLSLALALPLRLEEAKDNVPCLKPSDVFERWALELDLCGAMIVVVGIEAMSMSMGGGSKLNFELFIPRAPNVDYDVSNKIPSFQGRLAQLVRASC